MGVILSVGLFLIDAMNVYHESELYGDYSS